MGLWKKEMGVLFVKIKKSKNKKVKICSYSKHSSIPSYHYLRVKVLTKNECFFDKEKVLPSNIDPCGKDKTIFGWDFCWSCEEDYSEKPIKLLEEAILMAERIAKRKNVLECKVFDAFQ